MKTGKIRRPILNEIDLDQTMADLLECKAAGTFITMSPNQWDGLLSSAYDGGWTLLEIVDERPVAAYRKQDAMQ